MILLDVGYKNYIDAAKIHCIISPNTAKAKWLKKEAIDGRTILDCTQGRKTNSVIILNTHHLVLSSLKYKSLLKRIESCHLDPCSITVDFNAELLKAAEKLEE